MYKRQEQSIQITASSGLSDADIEKLVKEAEAHAADDKKKQDLISARNQADGLIYGTEKSIKDLGDKLDAALKSDIEGKIASLKTLMEGEDVEAIKKATEELAQASHKLAEQLYSQAQGQQPGADAAGAAGAQPGAGAAGGKKAFGPFLIAPDGFYSKRGIALHFPLLFFAPDLLERQGMTAGKE